MIRGEDGAVGVTRTEERMVQEVGHGQRRGWCRRWDMSRGEGGAGGGILAEERVVQEVGHEQKNGTVGQDQKRVWDCSRGFLQTNTK